jgi:hypothetical protein
MINRIQLPTPNVTATTQIKNNPYPSPVQRANEAGSHLSSSTKKSGGFFSAIINFFKWIFCCWGQTSNPAEELSPFGKFFECKVREAWPHHGWFRNDAERMEAAVRLVEGEFGNMGEPTRTQFRLEIAKELLKRDDLSPELCARMHASLTILAGIIHGHIDTTTLERTIEGIEERAEQLCTPMSPGTLRAKTFLEHHLRRAGFDIFQAVDNGDCFFAAFAESLSHLKGEQFTHTQLRGDVAAAVRSDMIIRRIGQDCAMGGYTDVLDWQEKIAKSCDSGEVPVWGRGNIEGVLLCNKYGVNLTIIDVYPDHEGILQSAENEFEPESGKAAETIYMGSYPGHFFPMNLSVNSI